MTFDKGIDRVSIPYRYLFWYNLNTMNKTRKIGKNSQGTYYVSLPKGLIKELGFREKQKVVVKKRGKGILIEDWKDK